MKPCVLTFSTAYHPFIGGAEIAIKEITDRIPDIDFELVTARFDKNLPQEECIGNVRVHRIGFGTPFDKALLPLLGTIKVLGIMRKHRPDAFWCMMVTFASGIAYIVNILRFWDRISVVLTLQEGDSEAHINRKRFGFIGLSWRLTLARTNLVSVISTYLEKRARYYGYKGEVVIVPNGVAVERFTQDNSKNTGRDIRKELGLNKEDVVLITTSRLTEKNALDEVISALQYVPAQVKFMVLGDGEQRSMLEQQVERLGVCKQVFFLGAIAHQDVPLYLHASDIFIRPSRSEGMGNSFIEAMAARVPVIATPVGGIVDFVFSPETTMGNITPTGLFCEVDNPQSIAQQIMRYIEDVSLRERIVENAYNLVCEKYDWNYIAHDMRKKVFERIVNKS